MDESDIIDHLQAVGWARPIDLCHAVYGIAGDDLVLRASRTLQRMATAGTLARNGLHYRLSGVDIGPPPVGSVRDLPALQAQAEAVAPLPRKARPVPPAPKLPRVRAPRIRPSRATPRGPSVSEQIAADPDLGRIPAADIASRYGVKAQTVRRVMRRAGVAGRIGKPPGDYPHILADPDLGRIPDKYMAQRHEVAALTIRRLRSAHGIPMRMGRPLHTLALQREAVCAVVLTRTSRRKAIMEATGLDQDQVCTALTWLVKAGRIVRVGRGVYAPSSTARPPVDGVHLRAGVSDE